MIKYLKDTKNIIVYVTKIVIEYIIPILSCVISLIASYRTRKLSKTEEKIKELEAYIKIYEVEQINNKKKIENEPVIKINDCKKFNGYCKMKIYNSGGSRAKNISLNIQEKYNIIINDELPYKYLDPDCEFELKLIYSSISISPFEITFYWEDEKGKSFNGSTMKQI